MKMKKIISILLVVVFGLALVLTGCAPQPSATTSPAASTSATTSASSAAPSVAASSNLAPIKIGVMFPITGPNADAGKKCRLACEINIKKINDAGGIGGRKLEMIFADDESQPAVGVAATEKLIVQDKVDVMCGIYNSSVALASIEVNKREKTPIVITVAASSTVTRQNNPYVTRTVMPLWPTGELFGAYMVKQNPTAKKIAIIRENTDYGLDFSKLAKTGIAGKLEVVEETYNPGDTDFYTQLTKIKNSGAEVMFMTSNITEGSQIAKQRKELGITIPYYASGSAAIDEFYKLAGDAADGLTTLNTFDLNSKDPEVMAFIKAYQDTYKLQPDMFVGNTYDGITVIAKAAEAVYKANGNKWPEDQAALREALNNEIWKSDVKGIMGQVKFNKYGEAATDVYWVTWKAGKLEYVDKWEGSYIYDNYTSKAQ